MAKLAPTTQSHYFLVEVRATNVAIAPIRVLWLQVRY
mgnify:CR=1 FL=1